MTKVIFEGRRFFASVFDGDGLFYVFDGRSWGVEVAGPYDTIEQAERVADALNHPNSVGEDK